MAVAAGLGIGILFFTEKNVALAIDGEHKKEISTRTATVGDALKEADVKIYEGDVVEPGLTETVKDKSKIEITRAFDVKIVSDWQTQTIKTTPCTVKDILNKADLDLNDLDKANYELTDKINEPTEIKVARVVQHNEYAIEEMPRGVEKRADNSLEAGETKIIKDGQKGYQKVYYTATYRDGVLVDRVKTNVEVIQSSQDQVLAYGTRDSSLTLASRSGDGSQRDYSQTAQNKLKNHYDSNKNIIKGNKVNASYSKVLNCSSTAYTGGGRTASGAAARVGIVAVDPRVIKLGTKLYIEGYGYAIAGDTGGAIKGNIVDVYFNTKGECTNWGRRPVKVYILD